MFGKKKKVNGMPSKSRTRKEVDADYSKEAVYFGHKSRMLAQLNQDVNKLEKELEAHLDNLLALNQEGMKLPPEAAPADSSQEVAS